MTLLRLVLSRAGMLAAAAALACGLLAGASADPAGASTAGLSSADWTGVTLPADYFVGAGAAPVSPVSCVAGTQFCVAITNDSATNVYGDHVGQADVVTTDGGQTWKGYADLPSSIMVTAISCVSTTVCWVSGPGAQDQPDVAETTDGGQTWTDMTPSDWRTASYSWWPNSIDCVTATTCWLAGETANSLQNPEVAETTDGGATWTTFTNLPTFASPDPNGTYLLNGISCVSALECVAVGGLNEADGTATVISTVDGGATWSRSSDPTLSGVEQLFSVSCLPGSDGLPVCTTAADALEAAGPVVLRSTDGGATWSGTEALDSTGWMNSVSCADTQHCWATGAGTELALVGTADSGSSWSAATSDTTNEEGQVSCATASFCVAATDNALWMTTDGGGIGSALARHQQGAGHVGRSLLAAQGPVMKTLPKVSAPVVWGRIGRSFTLTGQYRGTQAASSATVSIKSASGATLTRTITIGLNHYYSATIAKVTAGTTTVTFTAGNAEPFVVTLHGHSAAAPRIAAVSADAGPARGGTVLTITGSNFRRVTGVDFGTTAGTKLDVASPTKLTIQAPAGTGAVFLRVVTAHCGPSPLTGHAVFSYVPAPVVAKLSPRSGPAHGGTSVTITGTGLAFVRAVWFGSHRATRVRVLSARQIKVSAPAGSGTVRVKVVTAGGTTASVAADRYTY